MRVGGRRSVRHQLHHIRRRGRGNERKQPARVPPPLVAAALVCFVVVSSIRGRAEEQTRTRTISRFGSFEFEFDFEFDFDSSSSSPASVVPPLPLEIPEAALAALVLILALAPPASIQFPTVLAVTVVACGTYLGSTSTILGLRCLERSKKTGWGAFCYCEQ